MNIWETKDGYEIAELLAQKLMPKKQYSVTCSGKDLQHFLYEELGRGSTLVNITDITEDGHDKKFVVVLQYAHSN